MRCMIKFHQQLMQLLKHPQIIRYIIKHCAQQHDQFQGSSIKPLPLREACICCFEYEGTTEAEQLCVKPERHIVVIIGKQRRIDNHEGKQ